MTVGSESSGNWCSVEQIPYGWSVNVKQLDGQTFDSTHIETQGLADLTLLTR